jgi:adenine phosphoribosyltransferase
VNSKELRALIRDVPDFPKPGILFKDITPLLSHAEAFESAVDLVTREIRDFKPQKIAAIESRGFILGAAVARSLRLGLVLVRKKGKLPWKVARETYQLEYGTDEMEMHTDSFSKDERVLIVDDVLATGGTALGAAKLCEKLGAKVMGVSTLIELEFLKGREILQGFSVSSVIKY